VGGRKKYEHAELQLNDALEHGKKGLKITRRETTGLGKSYPSESKRNLCGRGKARGGRIREKNENWLRKDKGRPILLSVGARALWL